MDDEEEYEYLINHGVLRPDSGDPDEDFVVPQAVGRFDGGSRADAAGESREEHEDIYPFAWALDGRNVNERVPHSHPRPTTPLVCACVCLSLSVCLSVCLLSLITMVCVSLDLYVVLSVCLSVCPPVYLSVCLSFITVVYYLVCLCVL